MNGAQVEHPFLQDQMMLHCPRFGCCYVGTSASSQHEFAHGTTPHHWVGFLIIIKNDQKWTNHVPRAWHVSSNAGWCHVCPFSVPKLSSCIDIPWYLMILAILIFHDDPISLIFYIISHDDILMSHDIEGRSQVPSICFGSTWLHERGFVPDLCRGAALRVQWLECFWNVMLLQKWSEKGAFDHYRYHVLIFSNMF